MTGIILAMTLICTVVGANASINLYRHVKSTHSDEGGPSASPHLWTMGWFVLIGLGAAAGYLERDHIHGLASFLTYLIGAITLFETVKALRASYYADWRARRRWHWNNAGLLAMPVLCLSFLTGCGGVDPAVVASITNDLADVATIVAQEKPGKQSDKLIADAAAVKAVTNKTLPAVQKLAADLKALKVPTTQAVK